MTLQEYEERFLDGLIDNWNGVNWNKYVKNCYLEYMDSKSEQKIAEWENNK